jgi:NADPH2:quinone reductase
MRAVVIERFGDPSGMAVREVPAPTPTADQLVISSEAIGVGGVDAVIRRGTLSGYGFAEGLIPGSEVAGTVTAIGNDVDPSWLGRRVWAFTGTSGGYADQATARIEDATALPDKLSSIDAVTLGSAAPVAHFALAHAHFTEGESVLVRGAAGSIGIATVELAAHAGAGLIAVTTSSPERGQRLRKLGATLVLDRSGRGSDDPSDHANHNDPGTFDFDIIIDIVGGNDIPTFIDRLAPNGRMIVVGAVAGMPPSDFGMHLMHSFQRSRSIATFSLNTVPVAARNTVRAQHFDAAANGHLHPVVHDVLKLDQAAEAHRQMDNGTVFGRIVLTP